MVSTLSTFVKMKFPKDPFGRSGNLDINTKYLRSLKCRVLVDSEDSSFSLTKKHKAAMSSRGDVYGDINDLTSGMSGYSSRMSEIEMDLFDPEFYVLESYLLNNGPRADLWFGWVDDEGNIYNDYRVPVMLVAVEPKITPTGTAIKAKYITTYLTAKNDGAEGARQFKILNQVLSVTRKFKKGGKAARQADVKRFKNLDKKGRAQDRTVTYDENVYYFDSITDIVKLIASQMQFDYDIDDIDEPWDGRDFEFVNSTAYDMIAELCQSATSLSDIKDSSRSGQYKFWFETGKLYFKKNDNTISKYTPDPQLKKVTYLGQNSVTLDTLVRDLASKTSSETITIDLDLKIQTAMLEAMKTKAISYDPVQKYFKGDCVESLAPATSSRNFVRGVLGQDDPQLRGVRDSSDVSSLSDAEQSKRLEDNNITTMFGPDNQRNWFVYEEAQTVAQAEELKKGNIKSYQKAREAVSGTPEQRAENYSRYIRDLRNRLNEQDSQDPQDASTAVAKSDLQNFRADPSTIDQTATGKSLILPHYDKRTAIAASNLYQEMAAQQVVELTATLVGDPSIRRLDYIDVEILMPNSYEFSLQAKRAADSPPLRHYTSGTYLVKDVYHIIDGKGFTTQITAIRASTAQLTDPNGPFKFKKDELNQLDRKILKQVTTDKVIGQGGESPAAETSGSSLQGVNVGGGQEDDLGSVSPEAYVFRDLDPVDFSFVDPASLDPLDENNVRADGTSLSLRQGPNSRSIVRNLLDPNNSFGGTNKKPPIDIFSLPGSEEEPE